jgi:RNA polymerase sigma-70 factor, ECF subfamily
MSPFPSNPALYGSMEAVVTLTDTQPSVEALYRADAPRLWRALFAYSGDAEIASDAVNEAYVQVIGRGDAVRDPAAWVWRTAFRVARGALQARRSGDQALAAEAATGGELDHYADPDLLPALRGLPEAQRAAVILFYYADLPIREIADRLGTNSLAVRANLSRGRRRLRDLLGDHDG